MGTMYDAFIAAITRVDPNDPPPWFSAVADVVNTPGARSALRHLYLTFLAAEIKAGGCPFENIRALPKEGM